jgi:hypothetical protein
MPVHVSLSISAALLELEMSRLAEGKYPGNKKGAPRRETPPNFNILDRVFSRLILLTPKYYFEYFFV